MTIIFVVINAERQFLGAFEDEETAYESVKLSYHATHAKINWRHESVNLSIVDVVTDGVKKEYHILRQQVFEIPEHL